MASAPQARPGIEQRAFRTSAHLAKVLHPSPRRLRQAMDEVDGFNAKFAVLVTSLVGTMWCAYLFTIVALLGLSTALGHGGEGIIAWIAQTFLQLVLLSVIMVGQNVQSATADARAAHTYTDVETILDLLDLHTQGGLEEVIAHIDALAELLRASKPGGAPPSAPSA
jgi:hypothetical protein